MRPGEVVQMRMEDIDLSGEIWIYRPSSHKTEHHGRERLGPVGPKAQAVLQPFLAATSPRRRSAGMTALRPLKCASDTPGRE